MVKANECTSEHNALYVLSHCGACVLPLEDAGCAHFPALPLSHPLSPVWLALSDGIEREEGEPGATGHKPHWVVGHGRRSSFCKNEIGQ